MAYVRSLREIPLDEEPHASVLAALLPTSEDEDMEPQVPWHEATADQIAHLRTCPQCAAYVGGIGRVCIPAVCDLTNATKEA